MIEKLERNLALLDTYGELLTPKQKEMFKFAYEEDLSLSEIGEYLKVSRSAVADSLKRTLALLENYEEKLQIIKKSKERNILYKSFEKQAISSETLINELRKID